MDGPHGDTDFLPAEEISRIEARIEQNAEAAERCRKFILAGKAAVALGAALLLATVLRLISLDQALVFGSISAVLGGIVAVGSNTSTLRETLTAIQADEARRMQLIDRIRLTPVGEARPAPPTLH